MQYYINPRNGDKLSRLGFGCMRFLKKGAVIDQEKAEDLLNRAIEAGVNYFDTAYIYPGSEACLGKFLLKTQREKIYVATKLPHYLVRSIDQVEKIFNEQLKRLCTDYIDYYLIHMLTDKKSWERMCALGIEQWIADKKAEGKIKNIGFSYHGGKEEFVRIIDAYDWEFCQIQYNYADENSQAGKSGLLYAHKRGVPVIIMEPLRGGRLANKMPKEAERIIKKNTDKTPAAFALSWLWDQPQVACVLSGMNTQEQLDENIETLISTKIQSITEAEKKVYDSVKEVIVQKTKVGCTGCGYCMPCPQGVDIPTCFKCLNVRYSDSWFNGMREYMMCTTLKKEQTNAGKCIGCGKCEAHCPQGIKIRYELEGVKRTLETPVYKVAKSVMKTFAKF